MRGRELTMARRPAVIGAVLAAMTITVAGEQVPSLAGLRAALLIAAGAAVIAALIALAIPKAADDAVAEPEGALALATDRNCP